MTRLFRRFFLLEQWLHLDRVGEGDAVEDRRRVVADLQHQAAHPAFGFWQAVLALLVCIARGTGDKRERAARQADEIARGAVALNGIDQDQPVGFGHGEGILPYARRTFHGYRILQEYFVFPEKFSFLDVTGLERVRGAIGEPSSIDAIERLSGAIGGGPITRLFVRVGNATVLVPVDHVSRLEADGDYVVAYAGGNRHLIHVALSGLLARLDPKRFVQVHRAHVVNMDHVRAFKRDARGNLEAELNDGTRVPVSRARAQEVRSLIR